MFPRVVSRWRGTLGQEKSVCQHALGKREFSSPAPSSAHAGVALMLLCTSKAEYST